MEIPTYSLNIAGKTIHAEFTDLAVHTNGSVLMKMGDTAVLVTVVLGEERRDNLGYFPLSVEFEERFYAAGHILGSRFNRREGRPSDEAVLSARIIDRTIRPLFDQALRQEIQVVATVLAMGEDDPDVLSVIGTSLALGVSDIPWAGPVAAVRIARHKTTGEIVIFPTYTERSNCQLDFEVLACGAAQHITMIEAAAWEVNEDDMVAIVDAASQLHTKIEVWQKAIIAKEGKPKRVIRRNEPSEDLQSYFANEYATKLVSTLFSSQSGKTHITALKQAFILDVTATLPQQKSIAGDYFDEQISSALHQGALEHNQRADGRAFDAIRAIVSQAGGLSPALHGSGTFYRGDTRVFTALTLGGRSDAEQLDTIEAHGTTKKFLHHYNFPPFSVGETGRVGRFNRRMIGHGILAEKALIPVIPPQTTFPYTIRLVSETLSSNGSSSMASVCASTLALMDGGVPITKPVAGIAIGAMTEGERYVLLTDIQGPEDEYGDMDLKVAGTRDGITAIQMDIKVSGISIKMFTESLERARIARNQILDHITATIAKPRPTISARAPHISTLQINPEQIGRVIGSGGKSIKHIKKESGVTDVTVEESGEVLITGTDEARAAAITAISSLTRAYTVGDECSATITRIVSFGAFAMLDKHHEGLIHISEIVPWRLGTLDGVLSIGESVRVKVTKIEDGKISLSIKQVDTDFAARKGLVAPPSSH